MYSLLSVTDARGGERCADRTHTYRYVVCAPPGYRPGDVPTGCAPTTGRCRLPGIGRECSFIVCKTYENPLLVLGETAAGALKNQVLKTGTS